MNSNLQNAFMQLKFTAKQLDRQARKAGKDEQTEKAKVEKAMKQGNPDIARIHAQNAVRKQTEKLTLMKLSSRIDAVAVRVQTASTMQGVIGNMSKVTRSMDVAMKSMDIERVSAIMDGFEKNFANFDVVDEVARQATEDATAVGTPQEDVDRLMSETADKVGIDLAEDLQTATPSKAKLVEADQAQDILGERLRALRN